MYNGMGFSKAGDAVLNSMSYRAKSKTSCFGSAIRAKLQCNKYQIRDQNKLFYFSEGSGLF